MQENNAANTQDTIDTFATHNDTSQWVVIIDGRFQLVDSEDAASKLLDAAFSVLGERPIESNIMPPNTNVEYILPLPNGMSVTLADGTIVPKKASYISQHQSVDLLAYVESKIEQNRINHARSVEKTIWWSNLDMVSKLALGLIEEVKNPRYEPTAKKPNHFESLDFFQRLACDPSNINFSNGENYKWEEFGYVEYEDNINKAFDEYFIKKNHAKEVCYG